MMLVSETARMLATGGCQVRLPKIRRTMRGTIPSRDEIGPQTPLRLKSAAALAFPDGSMSASGLRREAARGRLVIERIAGKDYTTLANIERMRELCRVQRKALASGSDSVEGETRS